MNEAVKRGIVTTILAENPQIARILKDPALDLDKELEQIKQVIFTSLREHPQAYAYYMQEESGEKAFFKLSWRDFAFIRFLDYLEHEGRSFIDQNLQGREVTSSPIALLAQAVQHDEYPASEDFYLDLLHLLRQLGGIERPLIPTRQQVFEWMDKHPSGLDQEIIALREANVERIQRLLVSRLRGSEGRYRIEKEDSEEKALAQVAIWWKQDTFHLHTAVRTTEDLRLFLDDSLPEEDVKIMEDAQKKGIPIFVTPYMLSLLLIAPPNHLKFADRAIRDYVLYSRDLVEEFGSIRAWEKEDIMEPGKPNAAGWILPSNNIHRRYPNVAIFIPSTMGRACGGLCAYCQRMYDFQNGRFNFDLERLRPKENWSTQLESLMKYFEEDSQLQDILITGGDAMMSSVSSLKEVLSAVLKMAERKCEANRKREDGQKYAEIVRVRLGTKIPIYLPQRISSERLEILRDFREKAQLIGIKQFIIQTHFSTPMEVTPEAAQAVKDLLSAGWIVTNQEVFTVAASRRGHTAKLRQVLNQIGVLPYYTFTVKGYMENRYFFANNSRSIQEQIEEKSIGRVDPKYYSKIRSFMKEPHLMQEYIDQIRNAEEIPFLATDRNTINLPGVGKSNTYRTIGITADGRRILSFSQDHSRPHSPIVDTMDQVIIIESKSVASYLNQLKTMGEDPDDYQSIWGYSAGYIETRMPIYEYPGYPFTVTEEFTNIELPAKVKEAKKSRLTDVRFVEHDEDINEGSND